MSEKPKCVRLMLTAIYADGTSVLIDIKSPDEVEIDLESSTPQSVGVLTNYRTLQSETTMDLHVKTKIKKEEPVIVSYYPTDRPPFQ